MFFFPFLLKEILYAIEGEMGRYKYEIDTNTTHAFYVYLDVYRCCLINW